MKILLLSLFLTILSNSSFAELNCSQFGRATTSDQKSMSNAIALGFLSLDESKVLSAGTTDYTSWKGKQVSCLADVIHYAKVEILEKRNNQVCTTTLDLHTKDYFAGRQTFEREYKPRNVETICEAPSADIAQKMLLCEMKGPCPRTRDGIQNRDIFNDCECSYFEERISFVDTADIYADFFNPEVSFDKPEELSSPFEQ